MRWLIFGHSGWIGSKLCDLLGDACIKAISRADNMADVLAELEQTKPDRVISAIGRTHGNKELSIDYLEDKLAVNLKDNLYGPLVLAEACKRTNIHLTYFGTGCIYTYDELHTPNVGFTETDEPNFFGSAYSCVKGTTDKIMQNLYKDGVLNLRLRMPFSSIDSSRNFISKIIRYKKVINMKNSMTSLDEMLPIILDMAKNAQVGTYNMTQSGAISHAEVLNMYHDIVNKSFTFALMNEEEQTELNERRSNNYLATAKLEKLYNISNVNDAVRNCLLAWKN